MVEFVRVELIVRRKLMYCFVGGVVVFDDCLGGFKCGLVCLGDGFFIEIIGEFFD